MTGLHPCTKPATLVVNSQFDGGNIICHSAERPDMIELAIADDEASGFRQWFYFRVSGLVQEQRVMKIVNAGTCSYPKGWEDYRAFASTDRKHWYRIETSYDDGILTMRHTPEVETAYYAYFVPYSMERHADLVAGAQGNKDVALTSLGATLDGQSMDLLTIGASNEDSLRFWVIARQHPGETMAQWWMEGFLQRLLDPDDAAAQSLRAKAVFYVVPNMNPDGARRGHLRANARGVDLNREWNKATLEKSPEVFHVRSAMERVGVDLALDVHGDEALPYVFILGTEGVPRFADIDSGQLQAYRGAMVEASEDFQTRVGYGQTAPGKANLSICANYLAQTFGCLAMTLEIPFKDNANRPDARYGWSPLRSHQLGAANVEAMARIVDQLR
jgi:murein tripeptide amidase MpaA